MTKLLDIITTLGIHIEYRPDLPSHIRGFYYKDSGDEIIVMNDDIKDETEFRHVLAHELGHYFTTITTKSLSPYSSYLDILNTHRNESRAIRWACDYLIPTYDLLDYLKSQNGISVADIAQTFKVSEEMITMKFTIMSLERLYWKVETNYEKNGFEYYRTSATVGFDANDKRIRKEFLGKSKKESELKRDQYLENVKKGLGLDFDKIGFGDYFIEWLEVVHKPTIAQNTYNRYEGIYRNWIKGSAIINTKIINLKTIELQKFINSIPSAYTADRIYLLLSTFFRYCIKERMLVFNPLDNVNRPKYISKASQKYISREDRTKLLDAYKNDAKLFIYIFDLMTGLRIGELCALTHADVDLKNNLIHVTKSLDRVTMFADDLLSDIISF